MTNTESVKNYKITRPYEVASASPHKREIDYWRGFVHALSFIRQNEVRNMNEVHALEHYCTDLRTSSVQGNPTPLGADECAKELRRLRSRPRAMEVCHDELISAMRYAQQFAVTARRFPDLSDTNTTLDEVIKWKNLLARALDRLPEAQRGA